jgi:hypothetical protein
MERVYRFPSRVVPQVYWHLRDCLARAGYDLRELVDGGPAPTAASPTRFAMVEKGSGRTVGEIHAVVDRFGALLTMTDEPLAAAPEADAGSGAFAALVDHLFACIPLPPEKRAVRWPRG